VVFVAIIDTPTPTSDPLSLHDALPICFGFIEVGTVTPRAQPGNPKPRMFRVLRARSLINRMGFNNDGLDTFIANVRASRWRAERSEEHTSELQSRENLVCRLLLEKNK